MRFNVDATAEPLTFPVSSLGCPLLNSPPLLAHIILVHHSIHQNLIHQQRILHPLLYLSRYHQNNKHSVVVNALKAEWQMLRRPELCCIYEYVPHTNHVISDFNQIKKIGYKPLSIQTILKMSILFKNSSFFNQFILDFRYFKMVGFVWDETVCPWYDDVIMTGCQWRGSMDKYCPTNIMTGYQWRGEAKHCPHLICIS